jgi:hypothetical protein
MVSGDAQVRARAKSETRLHGQVKIRKKSSRVHCARLPPVLPESFPGASAKKPEVGVKMRSPESWLSESGDITILVTTKGGGR